MYYHNYTDSRKHETKAMIVWKLLRETSTKIEVGTDYRSQLPTTGSQLPPYWKTSITDPIKRGVISLPNRKCNCFTTPAGRRKIFFLPIPANWNSVAQPMRSQHHLNSYFTPWTVIFLLLMTPMSHSHSIFYLKVSNDMKFKQSSVA